MGEKWLWMKRVAIITRIEWLPIGLFVAKYNYQNIISTRAFLNAELLYFRSVFN